MPISSCPTRIRYAAAKAAAGLLTVVAGWTAPHTVFAAASYDGFIWADTFVAEIRDASGNPVAGPEDPLPGDLVISAGTAIDVFLDLYGTGVPGGFANGEVYAGGSIIPGNGPTPAAPNVPLAMVGDGTAQYAEAMGGATPEGGALTDIITDGVFAFTNTGGVAYQVVMGIAYGWSGSVMVDDPFRELAFIDAFVSAGLADISDPQGLEIVSFLLQDGISLDAFFGLDADTFEDLVQVSFSIDPGQTVYFATFNDIFAVAESLPVPTTWLLLLSALAVWRLRAGRRDR